MLEVLCIFILEKNEQNWGWIPIYIFKHLNYNPQTSMPSTANLNLSALCRESSLKEELHIMLTTHNPPVHSSTYLPPTDQNEMFPHGIS
ncbi:hypothetical protein SUGI_0797260 [Cryptomeria japonica]|nr:hypothetical protein SUGI_0797260 [Cryptomeria japonica]